MAAILKPKQNVTSGIRVIPLSPYELYLEQVRGISDSVRASNNNLDYIPPQFGGLKGQLSGMRDQTVVQMIDFLNNQGS